MSGYVDIHAHVLHGIDDGPSELPDALAMLRAAALSGTATIVATPHVRSDFPDVGVHQLANRCAELRANLVREGIDIELVCGAEVALSWAIDADDEELRLASYGQRGTDLLIETPPTITAGLETLLNELRMRGFRITLAHPERSREFQADDRPLRELVADGVLLQLNASSLLASDHASRSRRLGRQLCSEGLVHALASDGHRADGWRPVTQLSRAIPAASELVGAERAQWMAELAPAAIIEAAQLPDPPPLAPPRRRSGLFRRF